MGVINHQVIDYYSYTNQHKKERVMICDRCLDEIKKGDEYKLNSQLLCEDCYMDALSPKVGCDPWAVYLAKSTVQKSGNKSELNEIQKQIINTLKDNKEVDMKYLLNELGVKTQLIKRELASLRHMEKIKGRLNNGHVVFSLW